MHEAEAWIQTFAGLSQDELGELLVAGRVIVTSGPNKRQIAVAGDAQRGFVRALIKRMNAAGHKVPTRTDDKETDDARLVAAQRTQEQRDQAAKTAADKGKKGAAKGGDDLEELDEETETENEDASKAKGKDRIAERAGDAGAAAKDGGTAEKTSPTKTVPGKNQGKGGSSEGRDWKLSEALHISAEDIHNYVIVADGTVKLSPLGESLRGRTIQFNGRSIELQAVELLNIRQAGKGADAATMFMLSIEAGVEGHVLQEYIVKGETFESLDGKVDGVKLLAAFQSALKFDGRTWSVANKAPLSVEPYTMNVESVSSSDEDDIVVSVMFSEVRTATGYARVTTADHGPQLVRAGQLVDLRVPNPNKHHHTS